MSLEYLTLPESMEVLKNDGMCKNDTGTNLKEFLMKAGTS